MNEVTPFLSVIVPAYQGEQVLPRVLEAIRASDLPREQWELIVVDDASTDATAQVAARYADRVLSLRGHPHGPGYARNRGVEASGGEWVVFIDADVVVHTDTLRLIAAVARLEPSVDAVFGAYDDAPPAPQFISQYRNLLHRYTHQVGAGDAETFWAGCGTVRKRAFVAVGGFDEARYPRPQIEDIELGYRLRDQGGRILLRPEIQGAHLKRWTWRGSVRTDLFDRGVPWVRLLLERGGLSERASLNVKRGEQVKTAVVGVALLLAAAALVLWRWDALIASLVLLSAVAFSNRRQVAWFARVRGPLFALATVPMNLWYYLVSGTCVVLGYAQHFRAGRPRMQRLASLRSDTVT